MKLPVVRTCASLCACAQSLNIRVTTTRRTTTKGDSKGASETTTNRSDKTYALISASRPRS